MNCYVKLRQGVYYLDSLRNDQGINKDGITVYFLCSKKLFTFQKNLEIMDIFEKCLDFFIGYNGKGIYECYIEKTKFVKEFFDKIYTFFFIRNCFKRNHFYNP